MRSFLFADVKYTDGLSQDLEITDNAFLHGHIGRRERDVHYTVQMARVYWVGLAEPHPKTHQRTPDTRRRGWRGGLQSDCTTKGCKFFSLPLSCDHRKSSSSFLRAMALEAGVSLDGLTSKLLLKEFKTVVKAMKSKDEVAKQSALDRFASEPRYLTEGGCMVPLLEAILPRKKSLEFSRIALKSLLDFLEREALTVQGLQAVFDGGGGSLQPLQILSDLLVYRDEVKKIKEVKVKVKKGDPIPEPVPPEVSPESELSVELQSNSLRALHLFAEAVGTFPAFLAEDAVVTLRRHFGLVPNVAAHASRVVLGIAQQLLAALAAGDDAARTAAEAAAGLHGIWAMECITLAMRYNPEAAQTFVDSGLMEHLPALAASSPALTICCLQVLDLLSINGPHTLELVKKPTVVSFLVQTAEAAVANMAQREAVLQMASVVKTLSLLAEQAGEVFEENEVVSRVVTAVSAFMQNAGVWEACRIPDKKQYNAPLSTFQNSCCILLGSLAKISRNVRKNANTFGAISPLLSTLQQSKSIVGSSPLPAFTALPLTEPLTADETEGLQSSRLIALRRVAEQALLFLLTEPDSGRSSRRWISCSDFSTDEALFSPEVSHSPFPCALLFEIIGAGEDQDLNNRGIKILSALLQSSSDANAFLGLINVDAAQVGKVSDVVNALGLGLLEMSARLLPFTAISVKGKEGGDVDTDAPLAGDAAPALQIIDRSACSQVEALYHSLSVLELMLHRSAENVVTFSTAERIETLAKLSSMCGPSVASASSGPEVTTSLNDPRRLSWIPSEQSPDPCLAADVLLRPIIFDVLACVAAAETKYRIYEGEVPPAADAPLPASSSPCASEALLVCKLCSNACTATLMYNTELIFADGCILGVPASHHGSSAEQVLNAALRLQAALASCGQSGLVTSLQSIADVGFPSLSDEPEQNKLFISPMTGLKSILSANNPQEPLGEVLPKGEDSSDAAMAMAAGSALTNPFTWGPPTKFTDAFPTAEDVIPSTPAALLSNPCIWPLVTMISPLVGILANPRLSPETCSLAVRALQAMCKTTQLLDAAQAVIHDALSCAFLSLGGGVALIGAAGSFGRLSPDGKVNAHDVASFLLSRGRCRQDFWAEFAASTGEDDVRVKGVDPNAGPSIAMWSSLFKIKSNDLHARRTSSFPMTASLQNMLPELALCMIHNLADVNVQDGACLCPLNYALILGMADVTKALIESKADINHVDTEGTPTIAYSFLSLSQQDIAATFFPLPWDFDEVAEPPVQKLGYSPLVTLLLDANVDLLIADARGCPPLMMALGLANKTLHIGGHKLEIRCSSYTRDCSRADIMQVAAQLLDAGVDVNFCNHSCMTALHIAAAQGHVDMIDLLLKKGASPNVMDGKGYLPIHYTAAACPESAIDAFDRLLKGSSDNPLKRLVFEDFRTGKSEEEKIMVDIESAFKNVFGAALDPVSIKAARHDASTVILMRGDNGMNALQLCMCAQHMQDDNFAPYLVGDKMQRMSLAVWLMSAGGEGDTKSLLSCCDSKGTSILHSASLLLQGLTETRELTAAEKRSKRVKYYPSMELNLLDKIFSYDGQMHVNTNSTLPVMGIPILPRIWTPLHAAIAANNSDLVEMLISRGADVAQQDANYLHFLASTDAGPRVCEAIVSACAASPSYSVLLNSPALTGNPLCHIMARPLHIASCRSNTTAIDALVACRKIDLNGVGEEDNGRRTAIHDAVGRSDFEVLDSLARAADRIDLLVEDATGATCVDTVVASLDYLVMQKLLEMRKNDVVERILLVQDGGRDSLLVQLEKENVRLAHCCGFGFADLKQEAVVAEVEKAGEGVGADDEETCEEGAGEAEAKASSRSERQEYGSAEEKQQQQVTDGAIEVSYVAEVSTYDLELLRKSDEMVSLLVGDKGVGRLVGADAHYHSCFHEGRLYRETF